MEKLIKSIIEKKKLINNYLGVELGIKDHLDQELSKITGKRLMLEHGNYTVCRNVTIKYKDNVTTSDIARELIVPENYLVLNGDMINRWFMENDKTVDFVESSNFKFTSSFSGKFKLKDNNVTPIIYQGSRPIVDAIMTRNDIKSLLVEIEKASHVLASKIFFGDRKADIGELELIYASTFRVNTKNPLKGRYDCLVKLASLMGERDPYSITTLTATGLGKHKKEWKNAKISSVISENVMRGYVTKGAALPWQSRGNRPLGILY